MKLTFQFMISRTTENVASTGELTDAFRSLTEGGDKPYITASELYAAMPPDQVIINWIRLLYTGSGYYKLDHVIIYWIR